MACKHKSERLGVSRSQPLVSLPSGLTRLGQHGGGWERWLVTKASGVWGGSEKLMASTFQSKIHFKFIELEAVIELIRWNEIARFKIWNFLPSHIKSTNEIRRHCARVVTWSYKRFQGLFQQILLTMSILVLELEKYFNAKKKILITLKT